MIKSLLIMLLILLHPYDSLASSKSSSNNQKNVIKTSAVNNNIVQLKNAFSELEKKHIQIESNASHFESNIQTIKKDHSKITKKLQEFQQKLVSNRNQYNVIKNNQEQNAKYFNLIINSIFWSVGLIALLGSLFTFKEMSNLNARKEIFNEKYELMVNKHDSIMEEINIKQKNLIRNMENEAEIELELFRHKMILISVISSETTSDAETIYNSVRFLEQHPRVEYLSLLRELSRLNDVISNQTKAILDELIKTITQLKKDNRETAS